jgi:Flp pilus assembly protein TadG
VVDWGRRGRREDRGAAAVEFALVAPLLLLLVFGIISYGYMLSFRQTLSQAAAEGARAAAVTVSGTSAADREQLARQAVESALESYGISCATTAMSCVIDADDSCGTATCVTVDLSYDYDADPLTPPLPGLGLALPDTLSYEAAAEVS